MLLQPHPRHVNLVSRNIHFSSFLLFVAAGSQVRGKRALASPGDPADTETMPTAGPAWSSSPASRSHRVLPSTPVPGSPGQPSSSHHAPSTQTGVSSATLRSGDATGSSASPSLTALPASENTSRGELCWPTVPCCISKISLEARDLLPPRSLPRHYLSSPPWCGAGYVPENLSDAQAVPMITNICLLQE